MKILTVEDDLSTRKLILRILERAKYAVFEAENGYEALQLLEAENINLIFTDILMPVMSGIEFIRHIKKDPLTSRIPIILCTSVSNQDEVREAISLGINGYILKPINARSLMEKVFEVKHKIKPILEDPFKVSRRIGMDIQGYRELLNLLIENAEQRLKDVGGQVEAGDVQAFEQFTRDLSTSAENLGAKSLQYAASESSIAIQKASSKMREKYLFILRSEIERLRHAVDNLH